MTMFVGGYRGFAVWVVVWKLDLFRGVGIEIKINDLIF